MKRQTFRTVTIAIALGSLLVACGGPKTEPRGPNNPPPPPPDQQPLADVAKKERKISKEVKVEFKDAVKAYEAAKKSGINSSNCNDLAAKFAAVYAADNKIAEAKFNEGLVLEECGQQSKAEQAYQAVLQKHPNFGPALNNLGQLYFTRGNVSTAMQYFQKAAKNKNSEGYANLAVIKRNQALNDSNTQAIAEAVDDVHRALAVDSFNVEAYGTLALVLYDHAKTPNQLEMARLICVQGTKVEPKYSPLYNILGLILLRMGKVTPALAEFRKAVALNPDYMEALMNIGAVTLSFRDYNSAEQAFSKVLTLDPPKKVRAEALVGLGVALRGQRKFDQAMARYKEAKTLDPSNTAIDYNIGILVQDYRFDAANPEDAIAQLEKAAGFLKRYQGSGSDEEKLKDTKRRLKNINEMIPLLREQIKMMEEMKKMQQEQQQQEQQQPAPAAEPAPAPASAEGGAAQPAPEPAAQPAAAPAGGQ